MSHMGNAISHRMSPYDEENMLLVFMQSCCIGFWFKYWNCLKQCLGKKKCVRFKPISLPIHQPVSPHSSLVILLSDRFNPFNSSLSSSIPLTQPCPALSHPFNC
ncbi:hypothetical protein CROQUDRAFT_650930 [Cronartium quercuum f. sp. fusiforme G11]|uniref:Uncharacterized protein n=1 Tax=Cronartium quercuum f. sp. fusiforme G11 TaxID=708437 RepID=A0A9P6TI77_9BASI|nr:hypothetical protein CROQUDRAFT_650930 [Cronartium quercuum f. sp. fusiforme G11]